MIIGFTGTQKGMTQYQKDMLLKVIELKKGTEFCTGDCIGSDKESVDIAFDFGIRVFTLFPLTDAKKRGWVFNEGRIYNNDNGQWYTITYKDEAIQVRWMPRKPYLERNKDLVDYVAWMIATPKEFKHFIRSGTWQTIRYSWKKKKDITIIEPIVRED